MLRVEGLGGEAGGVGPAGRPGVVEVQRGAVVDEPRGAVPDQQVGVAPRAVDVGRERVEPQDAGRQRAVGRTGPVVPERAGEEVDAEVEPEARGEQVLHLLVGLVLGDRRLEVDEGEAGDGQPQRPGELAHEDLGHEHLEALAGAAELQHVGAEVVGLDDARQRPALLEGGDVARGGDLLARGPPGAGLGWCGRVWGHAAQRPDTRHRARGLSTVSASSAVLSSR